MSEHFEDVLEVNGNFSTTKGTVLVFDEKDPEAMVRTLYGFTLDGAASLAASPKPKFYLDFQHVAKRCFSKPTRQP
jgi:hypothetical protein